MKIVTIFRNGTCFFCNEAVLRASENPGLHSSNLILFYIVIPIAFNLNRSINIQTIKISSHDSLFAHYREIVYPCLL